MVAQLADLRRRVEVLEAERDILSNLYRYGPALDYGDEAGFVACFADDGVFEVIGHPQHGRFEGKKELASFAAQHTRAPAHVHKHCLFDPVITVRGNEATSVGYFARLNLVDTGPVIHAFGRYHDDLVRGDDGRWRFRQRTCEIEALR